MNDKLKPAVIAGVVFGVLSAIPFVNFVNACCCLWAILGGMLASNLYVKSSPTPASAGDGAVVGAIAGAIGGVIQVILGVPLGILTGAAMRGIVADMLQNVDPAQARILQAQMEAGSTVAGAIVNGLITAVFLFIFAIIGGLIGIPLFEKRKGGTMPPPPPPSTGGPGAYAA
jgi:hypothetical protein